MDDKLINKLVNELETELRNDILPFWINNAVDTDNRGFYGLISSDLTIDKTHAKAAVLNARILWTYSKAYSRYKEGKYFFMAERAYNYIVDFFIDKVNSGVYWLLDYKGNVLNSKKQTYAIAFAIYGLSEFFLATGRKESLTKAIELYNALETHTWDCVNKGYYEAHTTDWQPLADMSLSPADMNVSKSMNTHLHIIEAYTNLYRVWKDARLKSTLEEIINITINHIIDPKKHSFNLFFDEKWNPVSEKISFGHDIEGSWLLCEAAEVLGNKELIKRVSEISVAMAQRVYNTGIDTKYGGLFYEQDKNVIETIKDWWPQAEAVVGFSNAYQLTGNDCFMIEAVNTWSFIKAHIIDKVHGEWVWGTSADGLNVTNNEKAGPWKCPYHNSRMCFEILQRFKKRKS
ncbi:AGE family epimerase/isomerase [Ruminiclostridium cellulolyticum]|uniref:Cellobiose 2-epimerase n=1 Tax=Ruminiclostridium cellulolyticum (strain ATCC 35319 / DSM 5812 / JCM 6584 / H10) TaxID=394503 RepID=B8I8W4_RUMCH|nr:AGE family epimerase/isomerase [Ruminiclostridium cellulolyticum]ACL77296.1 N-acylglucosamine 2-epimerase [Ruminiclostridium cellulolyticum H10]